MPLLNWMGREKAVKAAARVATKILREDRTLSHGTGDNILVHGDNLEALQALLPFYAGEVKCIYIDPPYNTGSAFEHYDDNLEHSTWLNLLYPRLKLLREFLHEEGSIWISIDDDEQAYLKVICDEIFGRQNFMGTITWQRAYSPIALAKNISRSTDFILVYSKHKDALAWNRLPRTEEANKRYKTWTTTLAVRGRQQIRQPKQDTERIHNSMISWLQTERFITFLRDGVGCIHKKQWNG